MSNHTDIGDVALFVYNITQNSKRRPYLRRNVSKSLRALGMRSRLLSLKSSIGAKPRERLVASDDEEDEKQRPAKRRKLAQSDNASHDGNAMLGYRRPFGQAMNESRRSSSHVSARSCLIEPASFCRRPRSTSWNPDQDQPAGLGVPEKRSINRCLPRTPVDFAESMRVDILQINTEHDVPAPLQSQWGEVADVNCRCGVAVFYAKTDEKLGDVKPPDFLEICRLVKPCKYRVAISVHGEVSREIILAEPFIFTPDHFYVYRRLNIMGKPNGQWDQHSDGFGFADEYSIKVFIEPKESSMTWPGMAMLSDSYDGVRTELGVEGPIANEDVSLYARTSPWVSAEQHSRSDLYASYNGISRKIKYSLRVQIRWSLPNHLNDLTLSKPKHNSTAKALQSATQVPESPHKIEGFSSPESPGGNLAARRRSGVITYELKALSSIAQGKLPRAPRMSSLKSAQPDPEDGEITVSYCFGKEEAETGIKRETTITGMKCLFCLSRNHSLDELRLHLSTDHSAYKFHASRLNPHRVLLVVEMAKTSRPGLSAKAGRSRIIQLGQSMTLFDLEKYLNGDKSWIKARSGPQHNVWPAHLVQKHFNGSSHSSSPHNSRHSSPNTPRDTDNNMEVDRYEPRVAVKQRKVHYVPNIPKPLFDTVTKRLLVAGEELVNSDDETDESWLHQQRRDGINDFSDIPPEEKEYINRFNHSIFEERLTSMKHLPDAIARFVEANKSWIVAKVSRRKEFSKHMENFILKGNVDERCHDQCIRILIAEAETMNLNHDEHKDGREEDFNMDKVAQPAPQKRGLHSCVCGEVTMPPKGGLSWNEMPSTFLLPTMRKRSRKTYHRPLEVL